MTELAQFYKKLYSLQAAPDVSYDMLHNLDLPQLNKDKQVILDEPIVYEEVVEATKALKKTLGTDGLLIEIYKRLSYKIAILVKLFEEINITKCMHVSAWHGIIALLEKPDRNGLLIPNWRPLTLLNCDYKIYSEILATRLNIVLPKLIHPMQTGFMKGRHITENIVELKNLIDKCNEISTSGILISFDFYKAFDTVEWPAIKQILRAFNFTEKFINMTMILYTKQTTAVLNNGFWSQWFSPSRGTRQGNPISPLIFDLIEILGAALRQNKNSEA